MGHHTTPNYVLTLFPIYWDKWQILLGIWAQSLCNLGRAGVGIGPIDCKTSFSVIIFLNFFLGLLLPFVFISMELAGTWWVLISYPVLIDEVYSFSQI